MHVEAEPLHRQPADRRQQGIGRDDPIMLRRDQRDAGVDQFLLRVEHVERRALADARLFAHAVERDFGGVDLRGRRFDLRLGGVELAPALHHRRPRLIAIDVEIEPLLADRFLGLADGRNIRRRPDRSASSIGRRPKPGSA